MPKLSRSAQRDNLAPVRLPGSRSSNGPAGHSASVLQRTLADPRAGSPVGIRALQRAAGNRAVLVRKEGGQDTYYQVALDDLLKDGRVEANAPVLPGDILIIPQSWF